MQDNNLKKIRKLNNLRQHKHLQNLHSYIQKRKTIHILTHQNINLFVSLRVFLLLIKIELREIGLLECF